MLLLLVTSIVEITEAGIYQTVFQILALEKAFFHVNLKVSL